MNTFPINIIAGASGHARIVDRGKPRSHSIVEDLASSGGPVSQSRLQFSCSNAEQQSHDWDTASPGRHDLRPNVRPLQRPRSKQHDQFVCTLQEIEDVFLEVRSRIDLCFVEERRRTACFDLPSDLSCDPSVLAAMAHEHEPLFARWLIHRSAPLYLNTGRMLGRAHPEGRTLGSDAGPLVALD